MDGVERGLVREVGGLLLNALLGWWGLCTFIGSIAKIWSG